MRSYCILNSSELNSVDFSQVLQTSADTLGYSTDGSKFVVKFEGDTPSFLVGKPQHNHAQILEILNGPEWASSE